MNNEMRMRKRQMLESLEYLDDDLISGVLRKIKPEREYADPVRTWRTPLKHWKSIAVLAACTVLLAFAAPTASFISQVISNYSSVAGGNAGAGTAESEVIDTSFDKYLETFSEMSADEIYAEVLKGGWIVQDVDLSTVFDAGEDIWQNFLDSVDNDTPTAVLFAEFSISGSGVHLSEICYDGETFTITQQRRDDTSVLETETKEFKYFLRSRWPCYYFTNNLDSDPANYVSSDSKDVVNLESHFVVIWTYINSETEK